jgi:hypothetical protein
VRGAFASGRIAGTLVPRWFVGWVRVPVYASVINEMEHGPMPRRHAMLVATGYMPLPSRSADVMSCMRSNFYK